MIRAAMETRAGRTVVLGLSEENVRRLKDGKPILVDVAELLEGPGTRPRRARIPVCIMYGETEQAIAAELREAVEGRASGTLSFDPTSAEDLADDDSAVIEQLVAAAAARIGRGRRRGHRALDGRGHGDALRAAAHGLKDTNERGTTMAECAACGQEMTEGAGCLVGVYDDFKDGVGRTRVRYGDEIHEGLRLQYDQQPEIAVAWGVEVGAPWEEFLAAVVEQTTNTPCHDCAVGRGDWHHPGCDVEECPRCHLQALSCDCVDPEAQQDRNIPAQWGVTREEALRRLAGEGDDG